MSDEGTTHIGTDHLPPDRYLGPTRFRVTARCEMCCEEFSWETERLTKYNRACPNPVCVDARKAERAAKAERNMARIIVEQRPPGHIGDKVVVKAIDETARVVMEDYGMTNLQDNVRSGDMIAPKLPAPQQRMADGFFGGKAVQERAGGIKERQAEMLRRRAIAGAFRGMSVNPNITSFGRGSGESALRVVGNEKLK